MTQKSKAISFLQKAGLGQVQEAFDQYVAADLVHHNQYFKGDRTALLVAMQEAHETVPNLSIEIKHVYEDGDTVIIHSKVCKEEINIAVFHVMRFKEGHIVEMWDLGQLMDPDSPNENGMF